MDCLTLKETFSSCLVLFAVLHPAAAEVRITLSKDRGLVLSVPRANVTLMKPVAMHWLMPNRGLEVFLRQ